MKISKKHPHKWTLEEIENLANKQFPPPWSVHEAVIRLASYVDKYQNPSITIPKGTGEIVEEAVRARKNAEKKTSQRVC